MKGSPQLYQLINIIRLMIFSLLLSGCATRTHCCSDAEIENYVPGQTLKMPKDKKIVLVGGCFDLLHYGHVEFLKKAKDAGEYLVLALEPDTHILHFKHRKPTHNQHQRAIILASTRMVDKVILLPTLRGFADYYQLTHTVKPCIIAITENDPQQLNKKKQAEAIGAKIKVVSNRHESFSTSVILEANNN